MNENPKSAVPRWFWAIAIVALLWNIMGCVVFLSDVFAKEEMIKTMTEPQKEWARSIPGWVYAFFGVSVGTGIAGSIALLMRNKLALPLFAISFVAVLVQMVHTMGIAGGLQVMGPSGAVMPVIVVVLACLWLVASAGFRRRGWLN